jgi:hypothetical protein
MVEKIIFPFYIGYCSSVPLQRSRSKGKRVVVGFFTTDHESKQH